jgi:hypothetical protein
MYSYFTTQAISNVQSNLMEREPPANHTNLITKEQAFVIASKAGNWTKDFFSNKSVNMTLIHIKNDGFAFVVDQNTFEDVSIYHEKFSNFKENQYVWIIGVTGQPPTILSGREWGHMIDATNGQVLQ